MKQTREIEVISKPNEQMLNALGVKTWPIWTSEISNFPWYYDSEEICYILEGEIVVTPEEGEPVEIGVGNLVTFPQGLSCTWDVRAPVRKHYQLR
jgi:uncharacterized cupin superfamily protein